jgi:hypothetical protein
MRDVHIAGVSLTRFGKDFRPIGVMLADACQKALNYSAAYWVCQTDRPGFSCWH